MSGAGDFGDTWEWDGFNWRQLTAGGPTTRRVHAMTYDSQRARTVLFGGEQGGLRGDTWELVNGAAAPATFVDVPTTSTPPPMSQHAVAALPGGGLLLFGGTTTTGFPLLTYKLQAGVWSKQFSLLNPMVRSEASLILDPRVQNNLLFGGRNPLGTPLDDTWTFAGDQWTHRVLSVAPTPRSAHRMAYDAARQVALLFGGRDANDAALGDQWAWSGTAWTRMLPPLLPPARHSHGLAYDALRDRVVCYGGSDAGGRRDDLWEWNGTVWTAVTPVGAGWGPGRRDGLAMVYDPRAERVVVFGGETAVGCASDLWSWDGQGWTLHVPFPGPTPSPRSGARLVHDAVANRTLLLAGGCGAQLNNDLWSLEMPVFWRWNAYGSGCVASNGRIPALAVSAGSSGQLGQTIQFELANVPIFFSVSYAVLGFDRRFFNGLPLPLPLGFVGLSGCTAWAPIEVSVPIGLPNAQGVVIWPVVIPNLAYLLGIEVYMQCLSVEPPGYSRWASVSNAIAVRLGNQ